MRSSISVAAIAVAMLLPSAASAADGPSSPTQSIRRKISDPDGGLIVAAHRGCHNPAPRHGLPSQPENSSAALDQCVRLGVEVMETDVRRSKDGYLVIMHDATVDRTTDGEGKVADLTLAQLKVLRLRANSGGPAAAPTAQKILTLDEMLAHAGDRIVLNLDVKDAIYVEVADAVRRSGAGGRVIVKTVAGAGTVPLADLAPYDGSMFMPILSTADKDGADLPAIADRQAAGRNRPIGFEVPHMPREAVPPLAQAARRIGGRLWANSIFEGWIAGVGGDADALRDPDKVWGAMERLGISMIQTDEPEALRAYIDDPARRRRAR